MDSRVPDCMWGPWDPIHVTNCYFDPESGKHVYIKISPDISKEKLLQRDRLLPFWFGKAYRYHHRTDPKWQCVVIRPFDGEPAVTMWGPAGNDDDWSRAVRYRGTWYILDTSETWEFNFDLSKKADKLIGVNLFLNGKEIAKCRKHN